MYTKIIHHLKFLSCFRAFRWVFWRFQVINPSEFFLLFRRQQIWIHLKHRWISHALVATHFVICYRPPKSPPWSMRSIYAPQIIPKTICGSLILHPKNWVDLDSSRQFVATNAQTENSRHFPPSALDSESPAGVPGVWPGECLFGLRLLFSKEVLGCSFQRYVFEGEQLSLC